MREALAEHLLAQVMSWKPEDVANERPFLQAMATLKYDEYQQFAPGMRFVESLALWLQQFNTEEERRTAYEFVKSRLVFFSAAEIAHLVTIAYPDYIRPVLIRRAAETIRVAERYVARIANSKEYKALRRQCLFLGLSDSARIDTFRRSTNRELSHEQIWQTYEMSPEKGKSILSQLRRDLIPLLGRNAGAEKSLFCMVFLLDDFSGSGRTYLLKKNDIKRLSGKIAKLHEQLKSPKGLGSLVNLDDLYVGIVLYIATQHAVDHLQPLLKELFEDCPNVRFDIHVVQLLSNKVSLDLERDKDFLNLAENYYDSSVEDEHTRKGGTDVKLGFNRCGLPVVLSHNTPNNSMFLLWADHEQFQVRGLFPRISRHRSEP
ncbi:MAG TPA: hypothetical protein VM123_01705 [archaeon]|nr:hypothetical protein [archaeon]